MNLPFVTKWPVNVEIWEKRQDGFFIRRDKAKRTWKEGKQYYELQKSKVRTKPINPEFLYVDNKGKQYLKLFSPMPKVFSPMVFDPETDQLKMMDEDTRRWLAMDAMEYYQRFKEKKSFLAEYGALIAMITFCAIFLVILVVLSGYMEHITQGMQQLANSIFEMGDYLGGGPPV